jgi:hypothetical protein
MNQQSYQHQFRLLALVRMIWLISSTVMLLSIANESSAALPPPPENGVEGNRGSSGSRDDCPFGQEIIVLAPEYQSTEGKETASIQPIQTASRVWGLTTTQHPTLWFYFTDPKNHVAEVRFMLRDESRKRSPVLYSTIIKPKSDRITSVTIPNSAPPLQNNQMYRWVFQLITNSQTSECPIASAKGWIQLTVPSSHLNRQIKQANPSQKATLYLENGLWYDAITAFAELQLNNPTDPKSIEAWQHLLEGIDLKSLVNEPLAK